MHWMEEKAGHSQVIAGTPEGKVPLAQSTGVRSWCLLREANTASGGSAGPHGQPEPWTAGSLLPVVILSLQSHPWQCFAIFLTPSSPGAIPEQLSLSTAYLGGLVTPGVISWICPWSHPGTFHHLWKPSCFRISHCFSSDRSSQPQILRESSVAFGTALSKRVERKVPQLGDKMPHLPAEGHGLAGVFSWFLTENPIPDGTAGLLGCLQFGLDDPQGSLQLRIFHYSGVLILRLLSIIEVNWGNKSVFLASSWSPLWTFFEWQTHCQKLLKFLCQNHLSGLFGPKEECTEIMFFQAEI